ncbi:hypothetical protein Hanom_Chr03g00198311 [Helianthus anomalus]
MEVCLKENLRTQGINFHPLNLQDFWLHNYKIGIFTEKLLDGGKIARMSGYIGP